MDSFVSPAVSVIIPCFNLGKFLGEAIESVLSQNCPEHIIEVIVVDDGSTDATRLVALGFGAKIRYCYQTNSGLAAALNKGLQLASGHYTVCLDADDRLAPKAITSGLECFETNRASDLVFGGFSRIDHYGLQTNDLLVEYPCPADPYEALLRQNFIRMHSTVMYRTTALKRVGGFDENLQAFEDYDMFLRIARSGSFASHRGHVAEYRTYGTSMSADPFFMLPKGLAVLERQRRHVLGNLRYEKAMSEGVRFWCDYYGTQMKAILYPPGWWKQTEQQARSNVRQLKRVATATASPRYFRYARRIVTQVVTPMNVLFSKADRGSMKKEKFAPRLALWRIARKLKLVQPSPSVGKVDFGDLRRTRPFDQSFGASRGLPVDRYYIEKFLQANSRAIGGRVLEIGDSSYTNAFGSAVEKAEALHINDPLADYVGDLVDGSVLPSATFDCLIVTQTLHLLEDVASAFETIHRVLKPGGVALITVPGVTQVCSDEWAKIWRSSFTQLSLSEHAEQEFHPSKCRYETFGNVLAAASLLYGVAAEELESDELDLFDEKYPVTITLRCTK